MKKVLVGLAIVAILGAATVWASEYFGNAIYTALQDNGRMTEDSVITRTMNMRPYQIDEASASVTYMRYQGGAGVVLLVRISTALTVTTFEKSYDTWTNRVTATYIPVNDWQ